MLASRVTTLGEAVRATGGFIQTGPFGSQLHASDYVTDGTPVVMPVNLGDNVINECDIARVGADDVKRLARHRLHTGDIVFGRRGEIGRRAIIRAYQSGWLCGTGCLAVKFGSNLVGANPEFIALYVGAQEQRNWLAERAVGGTMPNLNTQVLSELPLELPARSEQDRVVGALDDVMAAERSLQRLIAKKRAVKQGMMQELLTGRTRLPGFNGEWTHGQLGSLYDRHVGSVDPRKLRDTTFQHFSIPAFDASERPELEPGSAIDSMKFTVPRDSVLLSKLNPRIPRVWAPAKILPHAIASTEFIVAIPKQGIDRSFLKWLFKSDGVCGKMNLLATGTTKSHVRIRPTTIARLEVAWPKRNEQIAIASALDDADAEIAALERRLESARAIKLGMMQELLTGRTRLPVKEDGE